jgi:GNAT superfamily N-acetyltransferase
MRAGARRDMIAAWIGASSGSLPRTRTITSRFFDHERGPAFADNPEWATCYCHYYQVPTALPWKEFDGNMNRVAMRARIETGEMEGYLAYDGAKVAGWMNAQPYQKLTFACARMRIAEPALPVPRHEAAAIVCLVVAPEHRRRGIARALLAAGLANFAQRGIKLVDAFPGTSKPATTSRRTSITVACDVHRGGIRRSSRRTRTSRSCASCCSAWRQQRERGQRYAAAARPRGALRLAIAFASLQPFAPWIPPDPRRRSGRSRHGRCVHALRRHRNVVAYFPSACSSRCGRAARRRCARAARARVRFVAVVRRSRRCRCSCRRATRASSTSPPTPRAR